MRRTPFKGLRIMKSLKRPAVSNVKTILIMIALMAMVLTCPTDQLGGRRE
jgi:hypothetical protein